LPGKNLVPMIDSLYFMLLEVILLVLSHPLQKCLLIFMSLTEPKVDVKTFLDWVSSTGYCKRILVDPLLSYLTLKGILDLKILQQERSRRRLLLFVLPNYYRVKAIQMEESKSQLWLFIQYCCLMP
jgi:hypothetical protein